MGNILTIVPSLLRDPQAFFESIQRGERIRSKVLGLAVSSVLFLAIYGFVTGFSHSIRCSLSPPWPFACRHSTFSPWRYCARN
jgi:hypothetical protein